MRKKKRRISIYMKRVLLIASIFLISIFSFNGLEKGIARENKPLQSTELKVINIEKINKAVPIQFNGEKRKIAYLTFDDGPTNYTSEMLTILRKEKVPATFFLIGYSVNKHKDVIAQMHEEGHYVGMHSMTHNYDKLYGKGQIVQEMLDLQQELQSITGEQAKLYRCPYGTSPGLNKQLRDQTVKAGLKTWDWTVDSFDWKYQNQPQQIVEEVEKQLTKPVEVILLHDKKGTIAVLPAIIDVIRKKGYEFAVYEEENHFPVNFWYDLRI